MIQRLAACLLLALGLAACGNMPPAEKLATAQRASAAVTQALLAQAEMAKQLPELDDAKKADIDKAVVALKAANAAVQSLTPDNLHVAAIIGAMAAQGQAVVGLLPLKPEVKLGLMAGLTAISVGTAFVPPPARPVTAPPTAPPAEPAAAAPARA